MKLPNLLLLGLLCAACGSTRVGVDRDLDFDFAAPRTYAWTEGIPAASELHEERIVRGVDDALARRGLERVDSGAPDLWVSTEVHTRQEVRSQGSAFGIGVGTGFSHGGVGVGTTVGDRLDEVEVGALVIALRDAASDRVVWRAEAEDVLTADPERTAEAIQDAIDAAFEELPRAEGG